MEVTPVHDCLWYAVRVRSNFEKTTAEFLEAREHDVFLPVYAARRRWADRVKEVKVPLFPGYVFCRFDAARPLPVLMAPGVVHIVSAGTQPVAVDPEELAAVRRMVEGSNPQPWPFPRAGEHVRIIRGPLAGLEGILAEVKNQWRIVVSVTLLQRSVAAEIDREWVERMPARPPWQSGSLCFSR
jgi:transcription antitermination factor NusG